jgi:hypothetical protein
MQKSFFAAGAALLLGAAPSAAAQMTPPCCGVEIRTTTISGLVNAAGTSFSTDMTGTGQTITLYTTPQQAGEVPRKVDLRRYRNKPVAVVCQLWHGSGDAWGCEAIGTLTATVPLRPRR